MYEKGEPCSKKGELHSIVLRRSSLQLGQLIAFETKFLQNNPTFYVAIVLRCYVNFLKYFNDWDSKSKSLEACRAMSLIPRGKSTIFVDRDAILMGV